ncbi:MAG: lipid-A-disaccharide synthase [Gammaproteobacteria bacterium]|nr:lipid-A-disaccharide synthase [Gammaproteobacteria bacterium]
MIGILAGEPSGDLLGASLLRALQKKITPMTSSGIGGPAMLAEGFQSQYPMERLSVMGLVEPLFRLPELFRIRRGIIQYFLEHRPAVFVGIDSPDFNLGVESQLRAAKIPIVHYVSPSVWAWRQKRVFKIAKSVDLMLTLFPFEADFYHQHQVPVKFVGHPLADQIPLESQKMIARKKLGLDADGLYLAVMPGSRPNEIKYLAEVFLLAAKLCQKKLPRLHFMTSAANTLRQQELKAVADKIAPELSLQFFEKASQDVMAASDVVLVGSGTATLEAMLLKKPMVIAYRMAGLTYQIGKNMVKIPFIGLPNLLVGEGVVPEFIQHQASPENISHAVLEWFLHPEKVEEIENKFMALHQALRCDASERAATAILELSL